MSWCVVKGCKSRNGTTRRENTNELVTFHLFPKDEAAKDVWVKILSRHNWAPKKHSRICSKHFAVDSFVPNDNLKYRRLKANVIPTLYLSDETNINKINDTGPSDTIFHFQAPHQNYKVDSYCEKSNEEEVCRVCLATDVKMFNVQSGTLKHCIESIYGFRDLLVKKELPKVVCYECSMHIIKYYKLIEKSIISQATLLDILNENGNITKSLIKEIDRKQLNLQSSLALNQTLVMECNDLNEENISNFYSDHDYHLQEDEMNINKNTILVYEQTSKGNKTSQCKNLLLNETKDSDSIQNITIESELNEDCDQSADTHSNLNEEDETESSYNVYYENIIKMDLCPEDASITVDERSTVPRDNIVKKSVTKRRMKNAVTKKEEEREITPDELAIEKLRSSYNIVELTLQEQMEGWQKEVGLPPRTPRWQHGKVFECKVCSKKFPKKLNFDRHTARHNAICGAFQCQICKERFLNQKRLNAHTLRTHSYRYECQNCPKVYSNVDQAMRHAPVHEGRVFSCPFCDYSSPARSSAWAHVRTRHAHAQHCALCGQSFVSEKGLALHHNLVHAGQAKEPQGKFPCEDCDTVFNSEGALRIHLNTSMQHKGLVSARDPAMKRTCVRCAATCASALELHAHMRREHGRVDPPARPGVYSYPRRCDHCDMEMNSRQDHWRHVLKEHKELRHLYKPKVAAMCDQCGKTLQSQMHLRLHMLRHGSPGYPCSMCSRQYYDTYALQRHVDTYHSSEKRHVCEQCGAGFKSRSNLTRHMLLHSEETPYGCRSCDKKFKYSNSLKLHVKHVHQKEPWPLRVRGKRAVKSAVVEEDN